MICLQTLFYIWTTLVFDKILHYHSFDSRTQAKVRGLRFPANILGVHDVRTSQGSWDTKHLPESWWESDRTGGSQQHNDQCYPATFCSSVYPGKLVRFYWVLLLVTTKQCKNALWPILPVSHLKKGPGTDFVSWAPVSSVPFSFLVLGFPGWWINNLPLF